MARDLPGAGGDAATLRHIYADLRSRVRFSELDPNGFDPRGASDRELRARALPPRPGPNLPRALADWTRLMSPGLRIIAPRPVEEFFTVSMLTTRSFLQKAASPFIAEDSGNWSGAVVGADVDGLCSSVQGSWIVPHPEPPPEMRQNGIWQDGEWFSSTWVGLDGHNPASLAMPQVGTQQIVRADASKLTVTVQAWWQWWLRDFPLNRQIDLPLPVQSGQRVRAMVTALDRLTVNLFLKNVDTGEAVAFDVSAPSLPGGRPEPLEQQTAEWVMECQTEADGTDLLPFNNYKLCRFSRCGAVVSDGAGVLSDVDLTDAVLTEMTDWVTTRDPGRVVSTPRTTASPQSFKAFYVSGLP